jgi:hypothetical protein
MFCAIYALDINHIPHGIAKHPLAVNKIMLQQALLGQAKQAVLPSTGSGTAGRLALRPQA